MSGLQEKEDGVVSFAPAADDGLARAVVGCKHCMRGIYTCSGVKQWHWRDAQRCERSLNCILKNSEKYNNFTLKESCFAEEDLTLFLLATVASRSVKNSTDLYN